MEPPLPEIVFWRLLLVAAPFAVWFVWGFWAKRTGRAMGATPRQIVFKVLLPESLARIVGAITVAVTG